MNNEKPQNEGKPETKTETKEESPKDVVKDLALENRLTELVSEIKKYVDLKLTHLSEAKAEPESQPKKERRF